MKKIITSSLLILILLASCGVTKTTEKCDTKEKKECCSKK